MRNKHNALGMPRRRVGTALRRIQRPPALQAQILQAFKRIHGFQELVLVMASFAFKARLHEVARAYLRDAFLLAQRPLTDAVIAIFKKIG